MPVKGSKFGSAKLYMGGNPQADTMPKANKVKSTYGGKAPKPQEMDSTPPNWGGNVHPGQQGIQGVPRAVKANPSRPGVASSVGKDAVNKAKDSTNSELTHSTAGFKTGSKTQSHLAEVRKHLSNTGPAQKGRVSHSMSDIKQPSKGADDY